MNDLRYDGPDLEGDSSGRVQGLVMAGVMAGEGLHSGRMAAHQRDDQQAHANAARVDRADRALWAGVPGRDWKHVDDAQLAVRWQAAARHCGDRDADGARAAIERELAVRDPDTMRDYRSWRYAAGCDPGSAMQHALEEREQRLAAAWRPLAEGRGSTLTPDELAAGWVAALGAHDPAALPARQAGELLLRDQLPELMRQHDAARAGSGPSPDPAVTAASGYSAAGRVTGRRLAFGPGTAWTTTLQHGTPAPSTTPTIGHGSPTAVPLGGARRTLLAAHAARARSQS